MSGEKLVSVKANSIKEFAENAKKAIKGDAGEIGDTAYHITFKTSGDSDALETIKFAVDITITRAHWAGGKADDKNKKAIKAAEDLNAKHEAKHRIIIQTLCDKMFKDAEKDLVGKTSNDVENALGEIKRAIDKANDALDSKEGMIDFDDTKNPIVVKLVGV